MTLLARSDLLLRRAACTALACCVLTGLSPVARAQDLTQRIRVRLSGGGATMVSRDQVKVLGFDPPNYAPVTDSYCDLPRPPPSCEPPHPVRSRPLGTF